MQEHTISTLFLDIGGVLLTNGWDRSSRKLATEKFNLDLAEMEERHHLTFDIYEMGKITLDEYLKRAVFYTKRDFSPDDFKSFMYDQSKPYEETIEYFKELKVKHRLKVIAVNNEGRELNEYRIKKFGLHELYDAFVSSCYVELRKPDVDIFNLACDIAQSMPQQAMMVDDRAMFAEVAGSIGIMELHFEGLDAAKEKIKATRFHY